MGQSYLTLTQSSLFLSVGNTVFVMLVDMVWLRENQAKRDMLALLALLVGIGLYHYPWTMGALPIPGLSFTLASSIGYALNKTFNRRLLTRGKIDTKSLTARSMLVGTIVILSLGLWLEGMPVITGRQLLILLYLSGASGAWAFTCGRKARRH